MKTYIFNGKFMSDKHNEKSVFIAMEGDNNSGVIPFEFDRYYPDRKGVDLGGYAWQLEVKGYILPEPHENVIGELTGLVKEVRGSTISVRWTVGGENTFLSGEGEAQFKAIGASGEVWKSEPFTVVVGQSINADGVAELYPGILTELSARTLALEGRMDTAESDIETLQGNVDALGSDKQDKYDETLTTTDKTVVGAINEVKNASDIAKQTADGAKNTAEAIDGKATEAQQNAADALEQVAGKYVKPATGIPASDLADGVQSALDKADSALQTESDPTVPAWAKAESKPGYTFSEIEDKPHTVEGYGITDVYTKSEVYDKSESDAKYGSAFKFQFSGAFSQLPSLEETNFGYVYNINEPFTTTSDFLEGEGHNYPAGTNVAVGINPITAGKVWDVLSGLYDFSVYYTKTEVDTALADKVDKVADKGLSTNDLTSELKIGYDDAVSKKHEHSNKATLDNVTAAFTSELKTTYDAAQANVIETVSVNGTPVTPTAKNIALTIPAAATAMTGATAEANGASGLVPQPLIADREKVLSGAGTWVAQTPAQIQSDWNQTTNTEKDYIKNKPTIPSPYTLPTASDTVLGGVKVGSGLSIDDGVLSAEGGGGIISSVEVLGDWS